MFRRQLVAGSLACGSGLWSAQGVADNAIAEIRRCLGDLELRYGGRLGVAMLDTARDVLIAQRGDERFPLCSTHKALAAAFTLARCDLKLESLARRVSFAKTDLITYSPVTGKHVDDGMTVGELCDAAVTLSDNTAANLLLDGCGGPAALTAYLSSLGDRVTRLDRRETALNEAAPGDPRDTTTPVAMLQLLHKTVVGSALSAASREQLAAWLIANKTGDKRLRAGVPTGWRVGDKTGSGGHNATNDVGVVWPPGRAPIIVTAYYIDARASDDERSEILREVGRLAALLAS